MNTQIKRQLILLIVCLMTCHTVSAQHNKRSIISPTTHDYNLNAWVKTLVATQQYESGNDITFQEVYNYDSTGHLTEYRKRGFGGEQVTRFPLDDMPANRFYIFDYDDDILEMRVFDQMKRLVSTTHYIYANNGKLSETIEYEYSGDSGYVKQRTVTTYDKKERIQSIEQYTNDELLLYREKRSYDKHNNLTIRTMQFFNEDKVISNKEKRTYTYDTHNNWISCKYTYNSEPMYTINRKIEYYK